MLRFYRQHTKHTYGGSHQVFRQYKKLDMVQRLKSDYNNGRDLDGWVTTQIGGFWFFKRWMLALDCDSVEQRDRAIEELRSLNNMRFKVIESSQDRFWIIVNFEASFKKCMQLMDSIPGVDQQYKDHCSLHKKIFLRAFPKNGFVPRFLSIGYNNNTVPYVSLKWRINTWYEEFREWMTQGGVCEWLVLHQQHDIQVRREASQRQLEAMQMMEERKKEEEAKELVSKLKSVGKRRVEMSNWEEDG